MFKSFIKRKKKKIKMQKNILYYSPIYLKKKLFDKSKTKNYNGVILIYIIILYCNVSFCNHFVPCIKTYYIYRSLWGLKRHLNDTKAESTLYCWIPFTSKTMCRTRIYLPLAIIKLKSSNKNIVGTFSRAAHTTKCINGAFLGRFLFYLIASSK